MVQNVSHEDGFEGPGRVVGFVVLAVVAAVVWWMVGAHEPEAGAQRAFASSVDEGGWYEFGEGDVGVVVYPGAWVGRGSVCADSAGAFQRDRSGGRGRAGTARCRAGRGRGRR